MTEEERKEKDLEQLKKEIEQKGMEIEQLKKKVEELRAQIQGKGKTEEEAELSKMFENVSELLDAGFSIFGTSSSIHGGKFKSSGLIGLINDLAKLAEKSQTYQKRINLGKRGVIDFRVTSRPLRQSYTTKPAVSVKVGKPKRETSPTGASMASTTGSIEEREPIVDVFEEEDYIKVMVELPGVEENQIKLDIEGNSLTISTDAPTRKYHKKVELPSPVIKDGIESNYRNGILEVKLKKTNKDA